MLKQSWAHREVAGVGLSNGDQWDRAAGARAVLQSSLTVLQYHGRETFAYLSSLFLLCYACHFFEAIFFLMGNHSESTNRTICPIVLKTKVLIIF